MCPDVNHFLRPRNPQSAEHIAQQLRELPPEVPAPYDFAEFDRRKRDRTMSRRTLVKWPHAAAAATLTAVVAGMAMLASSGRSGDQSETGAQVVASTGTTTDGIDQSQATREWLARQPAEPALVRVVPRIAVARLEDRIAWFDDAMTEEGLQGGNADNLKLLQQERARLMASLAQVRYAEALVAGGS